VAATQQKTAARSVRAVTEAKQGRRKPPAAVSDTTPDLLWLQQTLGNQAVQSRASVCPAPGACPTGGACHPCPYRVQAKSYAGETGGPCEQEVGNVETGVEATMAGDNDGEAPETMLETE